MYLRHLFLWYCFIKAVVISNETCNTPVGNINTTAIINTLQNDECQESNLDYSTILNYTKNLNSKPNHYAFIYCGEGNLTIAINSNKLIDSITNNNNRKNGKNCEQSRGYLNKLERIDKKICIEIVCKNKLTVKSNSTEIINIVLHNSLQPSFRLYKCGNIYLTQLNFTERRTEKLNISFQHIYSGGLSSFISVSPGKGRHFTITSRKNGDNRNNATKLVQRKWKTSEYTEISIARCRQEENVQSKPSTHPKESSTTPSAESSPQTQTETTEATASTMTNVNNDTTSKAQLKAAVICLCVVIIATVAVLCYLCYAFIFRKYPFDLRQTKLTSHGAQKFASPSQDDVMPLSENYKTNKMKTIRSKPDPPPKEPELEVLIEPSNSQQNKTNTNSFPVEIDKFENYLTEWLGDDPYNNDLTKQYKFQKLQKKISKPSIAGLLSTNINKNRYKNLAAYDETRVVLRNNEDNDYINANYIEGYENEKAFIATQAPMASTLADFWWMIWQEKVNNIIMLTELVESGTVKCEQYWPDLHQKIRFGKVAIESISVKIFSDYVYRQFNIHCDEQTRLIHHLQYTTWPDHGVPLYPQNFTPFVKRLLAMPQQNSPIVVHCNAGCGRTGTLILCDIVLRMAAKERKVDFVKTLTKMREQRPGVINNVNQYVFAHFVVQECLFGKDFTIAINDSFQDEIFKVLRKTTIKPVMEHLDKVTEMFNKRQIKFTSAISEEDKVKNRFSYILPGHTQIFLPIYTESPSYYINAVSVDCYRCPKKFIVTQQPLPNTISDFWKLIKEFEVNTIVSLNEIEANDPTCPQFWSTTDNLTQLQILEDIEDRVFTITKLKVIDKTNKSSDKTVNVLRMKNWKRETTNPPSPKNLIMLWKEMFNSSWKGNSQIVVTCYDGAIASGLFVALAYLIEKMNYEQTCDVFSAIRTVRQSREQFVQEWGQIEFLYKAAKVYIEEFDNYDNFNN